MRSLTLTGLNQSDKNPPAFVVQEGRIALFLLLFAVIQYVVRITDQAMHDQKMNMTPLLKTHGPLAFRYTQ